MENYNQPQPWETDPNVPNPDFGVQGFVEAIKVCLVQKYADFNGRANRAEFWWFFLFSFIVNMTIGLIPFLGWAVSLALIIPTLSVAWRRLHDIGRAGGWWFINFIPLVGTIIYIVWMCTKGEPCANRFGNQVL